MRSARNCRSTYSLRSRSRDWTVVRRGLSCRLIHMSGGTCAMTKPLITQAMIDAYDEYTHLTLDRRGFMEKLSKLAGSGAAAAVIAPMLAASSAQAAIVAENDPKVKTQDVTWPG